MGKWGIERALKSFLEGSLAGGSPRSPRSPSPQPLALLAILVYHRNPGMDL